MRFLYALLVVAVLAPLAAPDAFAQRARLQVDPELVVSGSPEISVVINNFDNITFPSGYPQPDTSGATPNLLIGASLFTRIVGTDTTDIGVIYSFPGTTAPGKVALTSAMAPALGCLDADGNTDIANDLTGSIALVKRGVCGFTFKVRNAAAAGAVGIVIYNDGRAAPNNGAINMSSAPDTPFDLTIPAVFVGPEIGNAIVDEILFFAPVALTIRAYMDVAAAPGPRTTDSGLELRGSNPFSASTQLRVYTERPEAVRVEVYNVRGQQVATLFDGAIAGQEDVTFRSGALASGVYFVRATGETFVAQEQITIVR